MLIQSNCVKQALNTAGLTLQVPLGQSYLVKQVSVGAVTTAGYLTLKVDNFTVASYRVAGKRGNELGGLRNGYQAINLMKLLVDRGLKFAIPMAEGQKLTVPALDGAGYIQVVYDRYTAGDIKATDPNGTQSKTFSFIQYLGASAVLTASGDQLLDTSLSPPEFPNFPCNAVVPPKMSIQIHGIEGSPVADGEATPYNFYTTYLKMIQNREVLFDEDRNGFLFLGDATTATAASYKQAISKIGSVGEVAIASLDYKVSEPLFFTPPLKFASGDELLVYLSYVKIGTHTMASGLPDVGLIMEVNRE